MFSWPMITALLVGGVLYSLTSVPQIPATSIFIKAASSGTSGMGYSRISVLLGATLTAARTFSTTEAISTNDHNARGRHSRRGPRAVKGDLHAIRSPRPGWRGPDVCYAGDYPDFVRKPTCKNGRQPEATNAALCRGPARTRGGPRPRPRVDARALRAD